MRGDDPGTPERAELRRTFRERAQSYDFWIDNGVALVGSPETVARKLREQHDLIGHDIFCARHLFGYISPGRRQADPSACSPRKLYRRSPDRLCETPDA